MLGWILRFLLAVLVIRAVFRFVWGVFQGLSAPSGVARGRAGETPVALVRDPVCGTFVLPSRALTLGRGDKTQYFCSERCRDQYRAGRALRA
jgi:YHS domain-containing protein